MLIDKSKNRNLFIFCSWSNILIRNFDNVVKNRIMYFTDFITNLPKLSVLQFILNESEKEMVGN